MLKASPMRRAVFVVVAIAVLSVAAWAQPRGAGGAIVAVDEASGGGGPAPVSTRKAQAKKTASPTRQKAAPKLTAPRSFSGPTIGDKYSFLNFEVAEPAKPIHTNSAKSAGAKGLVQVEILVDTDGRVLTAKARTGNKLLWPEAERAALATRLNRPNVEGRPARAIGFLVYRFGPADDE